MRRRGFLALRARAPRPQAASRRAARDRPLKKCQTACKPGSVPAEAGDDHSSGPSVAGRFSRPTRTPRAMNPAKRAPRDVPIRSCSRRGLPCRPCCQARGGLLPHPFTLTGLARPEVCFLWRYPSGHPGRELPAAFSPWSPDFPRQGQAPAATARPSDEGQMPVRDAGVNRRMPTTAGCDRLFPWPSLSRHTPSISRPRHPQNGKPVWRGKANGSPRLRRISPPAGL